jgi:hypothetical protein
MVRRGAASGAQIHGTAGNGQGRAAFRANPFTLFIKLLMFQSISVNYDLWRRACRT